MNLTISYSREADKFLGKNSRVISEADAEGLIISAVKTLLKIETVNINIKKLKGRYRGYYRIKKGDLRIIFSFEKGDAISVFVHDVDFRGNIYK